MTKNGPIDFAQSLASCIKKIQLDFWRRDKMGGRFAFLGLKMHIKELS
jgi:hypothetical protein